MKTGLEPHPHSGLERAGGGRGGSEETRHLLENQVIVILITTEDWVILKKSCKGDTSLTTVGVRSNTRFCERYRSLMDYESEVQLYMK